MLSRKEKILIGEMKEMKKGRELTHIIQIRITPRMLELMEREKQKLGVGTAQFIRTAITEYIRNLNQTCCVHCRVLEIDIEDLLDVKPIKR